MLCERCNKRPATVIYTQIINGHKESVNICSECAAKESIFENFGSLLSFAGPKGNSLISCPNCRMTLEEFKRTGRMGCGECYSTFRENAKDILKKIHGTSVHQAEEEKEIKKEKSEIELLREKLGEAIETENFEEAARLRDKIREIEREGKEA